MKQNNHYNLAMTIGLKDIEDFGVDFFSLKPYEKKELLFSCGMDVHNYRYEIVKNKPYRSKDNKLVVGTYFKCNERTDDEWLNSGYASYEAKIKCDNYEDNMMLAKLGKGGF